MPPKKVLIICAVLAWLIPILGLTAQIEMMKNDIQSLHHRVTQLEMSHDR